MTTQADALLAAPKSLWQRHARALDGFLRVTLGCWYVRHGASFGYRSSVWIFARSTSAVVMEVLVDGLGTRQIDVTPEYQGRSLILRMSAFDVNLARLPQMRSS